MARSAQETPPLGAARRRLVGSAAVALAGTLACIGAVLPAILDPVTDERAVAIPVLALGVALTVGLGLFRMSLVPGDRLARVIAGAGVLWALTALAASDESLAYSAGRVAMWFVDAAVVYVLLAFPFGRIGTRARRILFATTVAVVVVLYLPTALVVQHYPAPAQWSSCAARCPHNAFALGHSSPGFATDVIQPLREVLTVLVFLAVTVALALQAWSAGPLMRRTLLPVTFIALLRTVAIGIYFVVRKSAPGSSTVEVVAWAYVLSLPAVALCCAIGLVNRRLFVGDALERLAAGLRTHAGAAKLRGAMADALEDPTLKILYWVDGSEPRWVDESGARVPAPAAGPDRAVTEVTVDGRRVAILHDPALGQDPALVTAAGSYALSALENERLIVELRTSLHDLSESRARIVAVEEDRERRRIERDLHDGAQQRLVALQMKLELTAERVEDRSPEAARAIRELELEVDATIDEVRAFARGIYPARLAEGGLGDALRSAGRGAPLPTRVSTDGLGRYPSEIETTVYFACIEALQNAEKHARGATSVAISVCENGRLEFEVSDDGAGFDVEGTPYGAGFTNMHDRLTAVGGQVEIVSTPGSGTRVTGVIPLV